jgi:signal transduction histidine kinase
VDSASAGSEHFRVVGPVLEAIMKAEAHLLGQEDSSTPRPDDANQPQCLKRRIDEVEAALQAHDEFLSTLGHELRNPLSPILMQAQYLLDVIRQGKSRPPSTEWLASRLEVLCQRLHKFVDTLNRLMEVSRISSGRLTLVFEQVDLAATMRELSAGFERELELAKSELRIDASQPVLGRWDRLRIEQIGTNLLSNAIRYGAGKPIDVSVEGDGEFARLKVRDYGIGIAKADRERIFQRFERVTKQPQSGGFGIGLWIVLKSCRAMGGTIEVESELGKGSEFIVTLPRHPDLPNA